MKKLMFILIALVTFSFTGCKETEVMTEDLRGTVKFEVTTDETNKTELKSGINRNNTIPVFVDEIKLTATAENGSKVSDVFTVVDDGSATDYAILNDVWSGNNIFTASTDVVTYAYNTSDANLTEVVHGLFMYKGSDVAATYSTLSAYDPEVSFLGTATENVQFYTNTPNLYTIPMLAKQGRMITSIVFGGDFGYTAVVKVNGSEVSFTDGDVLTIYHSNETCTPSGAVPFTIVIKDGDDNVVKTYLSSDLGDDVKPELGVDKNTQLTITETGIRVDIVHVQFTWEWSDITVPVDLK